MKRTLLSIFMSVVFLATLMSQDINYNQRIWAINCGYGETDTIEGFIPDTFAIKGEALWWWGENSISVEGVENAAPARVYETTRFEWNAADVEYLITGLLPEESYLARLHFAELSSTVAARVFDIYINEIPYEIGFDIFSINGVAAKALVRDYEVASNAEGEIDLLFTNVQVDNACINGIEIYAAAPVGVEPKGSALNEVSIFPNPASERFVIKSSKDEVKSVTIFNIDGKQMYHSQEAFTGSKAIQTIDFTKGLYIVRIETSQKEFNKKLIVK